MKRSWSLAKESFRVLRQDRSLMVFPVLSFIAGLLLAGLLGGIGTAAGWFSGGGVTGAGVLLVFLFYLSAYFATIYFQVALVACVRERLSGRPPTVKYGLRQANQRLVSIGSWAVIAALVGMLVRALEEMARRSRSQWGRVIGGILLSLFGVAWSLATFFIIPVIAYEGVGGFGALKRSAGIISRRWGEAVIGRAGISLVMWLLAMVVGLVFGVLGASLVAAGSTPLVIFGAVVLGIGIACILLLVAAGAAMQSIFVAVLYEYAVNGRVEVFSRATLERSFGTAPMASQPGM